MALTDNLVSYWKFDGGATDSVASNDFSVTSATNGSSYGFFNEGYDFDGTNDEMSQANVLGSETDFSISLWFYENTLANLDGLICECPIGSSGQTIGWSIWSYNGGIFLSAGTGSATGQPQLITGVTAGSWHHLVITKDGDSWTAHLNDTAGTPQTQATGTGVQPLRIGRSNRINSNAWSYSDMWYDGYVDEVGAWNKVLSSAEITELYNGGSGKSYPFTPPGDITSTYEGAYLRTDSTFTNELDTLNTGGATVTADKTTFVFSRAADGHIVEIYTLTRS